MNSKAKVTKKELNNQENSTKLWQTVSEEEQNALKGGWPNFPTWPPAAAAMANASENATFK